MDEIDPEVLFKRQIQRRRIGLAVGLSIVACVAMYPCCSVMLQCGGEMAEHDRQVTERDHEATPEQRAQVERSLAAVEGSLAMRNAEFAEATMELGRFVARPDLGACPVHVPLRAASSAERGGSIDMNYDDFEVLGFGGRQSFPWATRPALGEAPRVAYARERITSLRESIARHDTLERIAGTVAAASALESSFWTWDVVVEPETWHMPFADSTGTTFDGGYADGMAYLHDYASGTVICAGHFVAETTSEAVEYQTTGYGDMGMTLSEMLRAEMNAEIERAISRAIVYRAGPPLAPIDEDVSDEIDEEP